MAQNNGVIEDHGGGVGFVAVDMSSSCLLAWRPHSTVLFPFRPGCDLIQLQNITQPSFQPPHMH